MFALLRWFSSGMFGPRKVSSVPVFAPSSVFARTLSPPSNPSVEVRPNPIGSVFRWSWKVLTK
jgi:hypothetical protein